MASSGPTQTASARTADHGWLGRPGVARFVRVGVLLAPLTIVVGFSFAVSIWLPADRVGVNRWVWLAAVVALSSLLLRRVDQLVKRVAPLAALLKLTLVFPDEAPNRFRAALRAFSVRGQQR